MDINKQEFMFMKHNAPDRCEPSIEVIVKIGVGPEGVGLVGSKVGVGGGVKQKRGSGSGWVGVRVYVNQELNLL